MSAARLDSHGTRVAALATFGLALIHLGRLLRAVDDNLAPLD